VGVHDAQRDQPVAVLFGVDRRVDRLVGEHDLSRHVGGHRVGLGADVEFAPRQDQEVDDRDLGIDVRAEREGTAGLDLQRVEGGGRVDVVGDRRARVDVYDIPGGRQAVAGPDARVGPVAALDAVDGRLGAEVGDLQVGRRQVGVAVEGARLVAYGDGGLGGGG